MGRGKVILFSECFLETKRAFELKARFFQREQKNAQTSSRLAVIARSRQSSAHFHPCRNVVFASLAALFGLQGKHPALRFALFLLPKWWCVCVF